MRTTLLMGCLVLGASCATSTEGNSTPASATPPAPVTRSVLPPPNAPRWDYEADGPTRWAALSPQFATCGTGEHQSPIDLGDAKRAKPEQLQTNFKPAELRVVHHEHMSDVVNTGHSIQVNGDNSDTIQIGDEKFVLLQYHFHSPSEHRLNGRSFPAELHFVHRAADGSLAVIGVLIDEGKHNGALDPIWANLPARQGEETHLAHLTVDADDLLPKLRESWRYEGSLTTPPCSEGVTWIVMQQPVSMSAAQLAHLRSVLKPNSRPVQPLNGRSLVVEGVVERASN